MITPASPPPIFTCGQLVKHRRYGYRGVVVDWSPYCDAPEGWYQANQTQPKQFQPWYHVLVHGGTHTTYAAQTSLEADDSRQRIEHPWVEHFFASFSEAGYIRNDRRWQSPRG